MKTPDRIARKLRHNASLFAALGDETRLTILVRLSSGHALSITQLTEGASVTRQAITKHLRLLEAAGLVHSERAGRERRFHIDPQPLHDAQEALDAISRQWDGALARLKAFVDD